MQSRHILLSLITSVFALLTVFTLNPFGEESSSSLFSSALEVSLTDKADVMVSQQVQAIIPTSEQLVDGAIAVLSKGWAGMSPAEREAFLVLFDPAGTGDIDEAYVSAVLANYQIIREELSSHVSVVYKSSSSRCEDMRLYYTDLLKLYVCPYFLTEKNETRKARTLIHEVAHMALLVTDRPYYRPTNQAYAQLTPEGSWMAQLPIVGPLIREIQGSDTLYHPDAYAHFTVAVSDQPGAMGMYVSHHQGVETAGQVGMIESQSLASDPLVVDFWSLES